MSKIASSELLGFAGIDLAQAVRDDAFDSRVGAKIGKEPPAPSLSQQIEDESSAS